MKLNLSFLILVIIFLFSCKAPERPKTPEQLRFQLKMKEQRSPQLYLKLENVAVTPQRKKTRKAGLFRDAEYKDDGHLIEGIIKNKASVAKFKDVKIEFSYLSKTKTVINKSAYVIYNYYGPNSQKTFSFKIDDYPSAAASYSVRVANAVGVN